MAKPGVKPGTPSWKKGLTRLTNESIARAALKNKGQKRTEEQRRRISEGTKNSKQVIWNRNPDRDAQRLKVLLIKRMRSMLERTLNRFGTRKEGHTHEQLGYTPLQFKQRIESLFQPGMTWENHGKGEGKWHVDHIKGISSFPIGTPACVVNALDNLQPLWEEDNLKKG